VGGHRRAANRPELLNLLFSFFRRRAPPKTWQPLTILTNGAGTVTLTDPGQHNANVQFYRSRMLVRINSSLTPLSVLPLPDAR
jgi:hypothetical protein